MLSLELQPPDHLDVIASFLTTQDLLRCLRVSTAIAGQMTKHIHRSSTIATKTFRAAHQSRIWRDKALFTMFLERYVVPGVTDVEFFYEYLTIAQVELVARRCGKMLREWKSDFNSMGSLRVVAKKCPRLHLLHTNSSGRNITETDILVLANNCHEIRYLHLGTCEVTSNMLSRIAMGCRLLSSLRIYCQGCPNLDEGIMCIARNGCLTSLCITAADITDQAIIEVARCCPRLFELYVPNCTSITIAAIREVMACNIRYLDVLDTAITNTELADVVRACTTLEYLAPDVRVRV